MYPNNEEERRENTDFASNTTENIADESPSLDTVYSEQSRSDVNYSETTHNEAVYNEPDYSQPVYSEQSHSEPPYSEGHYNTQSYDEAAYSNPTQNGHVYSKHIYSKPVYSELSNGRPTYRGPSNGRQMYNEQKPGYQAYNESSHGETNGSGPVYSEIPDASAGMYSPGVFVNQPHLRTRGFEATRPGAPPERNRWLGGFLKAICLVVVCALFSGAAAFVVMDYRFDRGDFTLNNQVVLGGTPSENRQDDVLTGPITNLTGGMSAQDIYDMARTQVVGINTDSPGLFGSPEFPGSGSPVSGSGFIISSDGYILTNYHVIEMAQRGDLPLTVVLNDGSSYEAKIIGFEANSDVAVIKIDATGLNPALIGNSDKIRVGQTVYAVGNPFGDLVYTMTDGIISALDRVVSVEGKSISTFQFSAAVNSGNSGGPIYDTNGEVLGIVTAKVVRGNVEGIGFAIPINDAIEIASELIEHGYISGRPLIGITGQTVSSGHAEYYDWVVGVYIRGVNPDSAAETAGIAVGDIITVLGEVEVDSMEELRFALRSYRAGDTTTITVWRDGDSLELSITFDEDLFAGQERPRLEIESPDPFENLP